MTLAQINFSVHIATALMMTGIIWFVQIVHYPLLRAVGEDAFRNYELLHTRFTGWVVGPLMVMEMLSGIFLIYIRPVSMTAAPVWVGLFLLVIIWTSTFFVQVPLHNKLCIGYNAENQQRLVTTNWIRTVAWTLRGMVLLGVILQM